MVLSDLPQAVSNLSRFISASDSRRADLCVRDLANFDTKLEHHGMAQSLVERAQVNLR